MYTLSEHTVSVSGITIILIHAIVGINRYRNLLLMNARVSRDFILESHGGFDHAKDP